MNINKIREDTIGTQHVNHLLACGSALMPKPVVDAFIDLTNLEAQIGGYEAHAEHADMLDGVYVSVARLIGAAPAEIALVENATVAWCHAFYALPLKAGDRIITCEAEYAANYVAFLQRQKRDGIIIDIVPSDPTGAIDLDALDKLITNKTALIAITWIPTNGGLVNPAAEVGKIAKKHGIPYLLDACQAVGQMPVDVTELGCDFLSATGRKFLRGPRGTGFLYVTQKWIDKLEPAMIDHFAAPWIDANTYQLRDDARRFENWENNYALRAGLGVAADYAMNIGLDHIQERARMLADDLRLKLKDIPNSKLQDIGTEQCAIVSFSIDDIDTREAVLRLRQQDICIGASDIASTLLDSQRRKLPTLLRAAPHYYNTTHEIDALVDALRVLQTG